MGSCFSISWLNQHRSLIASRIQLQQSLPRLSTELNAKIRQRHYSADCDQALCCRFSIVVFNQYVFLVRNLPPDFRDWTRPPIEEAWIRRRLPRNYRPITKLMTISKVFEKLALTPLWPHLHGSSNFSSYQSAY